MLKWARSLLGSSVKPISIKILKGSRESTVTCKPNDNLMDVMNSMVNEDVNIFGLCDKQLACTTCRIDILKHYSKLPPPSDQELDVLLTTRHYNEHTSRMACQIMISQELEGMTVKIQPERIKVKTK